MTDEDDTGNPARLPLAERARRGRLASESTLTMDDILALEFPGADYKTRKPWRQRIETAIEFGMLPAQPFNPVPNELGDVVFFFGYSTWLIQRNAYRTWRAAQPAPTQGSLIHLWLGEPAAPPQEPDRPDQGEANRPEQGAAGTQNPAMNRQCVADKARFLDLATWQGTQQATVNQHPEAAYFKGKYDTPTLLNWASEIDPRPKDQRGGRPRKS